jgi:hypothetical protein
VFRWGVVAADTKQAAYQVRSLSQAFQIATICGQRVEIRCRGSMLQGIATAGVFGGLVVASSAGEGAGVVSIKSRQEAYQA